MSWFVRAFVRSSVAWLAAGVTLGVAMAAHPAWSVYRLAHAHVNLLGFVAMMIFGVAYHVLPRFAGRPLHSERLAGAHWWMANAGLALMAAGFALRAAGRMPFSLSTAVLAAGGALSALGAYAFAWNIWRTVGATAPRAGGSGNGHDRGSVARRTLAPHPLQFIRLVARGAVPPEERSGKSASSA